MNKNTHRLTPYASPLIEVVEVEVEQGIAMTGGNGGFSTEDLEDPNPEEGW